LAVDELTEIADRGYYSGPEIKACDDAKKNLSSKDTNVR